MFKESAKSRVTAFLEESSFLRHYLWKYRNFVGIGLTALICVDAIDIIPPLLLKAVVDSAVKKEPTWVLVQIAIAYLVVSLVQGLCRYLWRMYLIRASIFAGRDLRKKYTNHIFNLSLSFFDRWRMGDLMTLATNDVEAVRIAMGTGLLVLADALFYMIAIPIIMFLLSPQLTILVCLPLPLIPWIVMRNEKKVHDRFEKVQRCFGRISAMTQESLNGIRTIKAFAQENIMIQRMVGVGNEYVELNIKLSKIQTLLGPTLDFVTSIGMVLLLFVGGRSVITSHGLLLSLGTFVAFQKYIQKMVWPMAALGMAVNYYQRSVSSTKRLKAIFSYQSDVADASSDLIRPVQTPEVFYKNKAELESQIKIVAPRSSTGRIEFKKLNFCYPKLTVEVLKNISLTVESGERIAILGMIGSGKSTLLSLLPRLYPVQSGMLSIDGIDINEWKINQLRQSVGYVTQDSFLFSDSILENICFGLSAVMDSSKTDQLVSVTDVLRIASIDKEIELFPEGYHTKLGERGVSLSGGQRQRLTIARALAKRPAILVLDDALSSVDGHTEDQILKGLRARPERNTEIIAAHRISTVKDADRILVLREGSIVQEGTHAQLISQCSGEYWHFYEQQRLKEDLESYA